jgi:hypothetical protein
MWVKIDFFNIGRARANPAVGQTNKADDSFGHSPNDSLQRPSRSIGLGDGFSLDQDGKIRSRNWLGTEKKCSHGQAIKALQQGFNEQRISNDEIKKHSFRYPEAKLVVLGELSPTLSEKLSKWPSSDQAKFKDLLSHVGSDYRDKGNKTFFLASALEKLAINDKLLASKDESGASLLDNLSSLKERCQKDGYAGQDLFGWTLVHSAYSKHTFHQAPTKGTCASATLGYVLWQENPSKVVGALSDWVYKGETQTRLGTMSRPKEALDPADPTPVGDQILQASLMDLADPEFTYSLINDQFSQPNGTTRERGLFPVHQERVLNSLSGETWHSKTTNSSEIRQLQKETKGPIPVALDWATSGGLHSRHMMAVSRVNDEHVYLRDPAGELGLTLPNSTQEKFSNGFQRMSRQEFDTRIQQGLIAE